MYVFPYSVGRTLAQTLGSTGRAEPSIEKSTPAPIRHRVLRDGPIEYLLVAKMRVAWCPKRMVEYRVTTPGYIIQAIECVGNPAVAELSITVCPTVGNNCGVDGIAATREKFDSSWSTVYCGLDPCEDQKENLKLIVWAAETVHRPEFIVEEVVSGFET